MQCNHCPSWSCTSFWTLLLQDPPCSAKRFFKLGSDYVWPRTINKILKGYWGTKGITAASWQENYVPFGFSNFQNLVNQIRSFAGAGGGQPIVVLTVVGSSIPDFLREYVNQGIKPTDIPVLGLDMVEAALEGLKTEGLVGTLNCWAYLQNASGPRNKAFLTEWAAYVKKSGAPYSATTVIDPMVSTYDGVHLWALAAKKAGSFDVPAVRAAFPGLSFDGPSGYTLRMTATNNYVSRGVFIGSVNANQGFDVLWQSKGAPKPVPFSP